MILLVITGLLQDKTVRSIVRGIAVTNSVMNPFMAIVVDTIIGAYLEYLLFNKFII